MSSDEFFKELRLGNILDKDIKFDVIFIDGLHVSDQVNRDICNSLDFLPDDGFIVLHDCNPPTEYHAREERTYKLSPAGEAWNGTVWKAFYKCRLRSDISCCCIDSDSGIGVITKKKYFSPITEDINPFYEFSTFSKYRKLSLNLISYQSFQETVKQ